MSPPYTVIVNTSDGYADCWTPFFRLFTEYWPDCPGEVLLNTQRAEWAYPGVRLHCSRAAAGRPATFSWSERLAACLDMVETPLVLYMQEDYFLESRVRSAVIDRFARCMMDDPSIRHIGLTHFGSFGPFSPTDDPDLWRVGQRALYRLSTQAGFWRKETLRSHLRRGEDVWMLEIFGSRRAWRRRETFLTANRDTFRPGGDAIMQYTQTGIIRGRWHPAMPGLFAANDIDVDFERRGFYIPPPRLIGRLETARRLLAKPGRLLPGLLGLG